MNTFIMPFNTYKQLFNTIYVSPTSFESPQERFIQATQSHWKLQFPMPEGYGELYTIQWREICTLRNEK